MTVSAGGSRARKAPPHFYGYTGTETLAEGSLNPNTNYVYANGLRIARVIGASGNSPTVVYYHTDALGSTRLVTSSTRSVLFSDIYQPWSEQWDTHRLRDIQVHRQ